MHAGDAEAKLWLAAAELEVDEHREFHNLFSQKFSPLVEKCKDLRRAIRIGTKHGALSARNCETMTVPLPAVQKFSPLVEKCKDLGRAIRIGTNHGSLSARILSFYGDTPRGMVESAFEFADMCRDLDFHNFLFSMKASNPLVMVQVRLQQQQSFPEDRLLHRDLRRAACALSLHCTRSDLAHRVLCNNPASVCQQRRCPYAKLQRCVRYPKACRRRRTGCWRRRCTSRAGTTPCTWASPRWVAFENCTRTSSWQLQGLCVFEEACAKQPRSKPAHVVAGPALLPLGAAPQPGPCADIELALLAGGRGRGRAHEERHRHRRAAHGRPGRYHSRVADRGPGAGDRPLPVRLKSPLRMLKPTATLLAAGLGKNIRVSLTNDPRLQVDPCQCALQHYRVPKNSNRCPWWGCSWRGERPPGWTYQSAQVQGTGSGGSHLCRQLTIWATSASIEESCSDVLWNEMTTSS